MNAGFPPPINVAATSLLNAFSTPASFDLCSAFRLFFLSQFVCVFISVCVLRVNIYFSCNLIFTYY
jgi:hypothetical protein